MWANLRYAGRQLRRQAAWTLTAVLVLGMGIGVATAMVAVLYPVLLPPLPYPHASQLVTIAEPRGAVESFWGVAPPDLRDWREQSHSFQQIAFYAYGQNVNLERPGLTEIETVYSASDNLFSTLGGAPALGRGLVAADEAKQAQVAVLSDRVWRRAFGASPTVLGQVAKLGGKDYTIVGVLSAGFEFPYSGPADVWVPFVPGPDDAGRDASSLTVIARLKGGVSLRSAQTEMNGIQGRLGRQYASLHVPDHVVVRGYGEGLTAKVRPSLEAMGAGVGLVWLIACASVAGLLLTRFAQRRRELAVRASLGASRRQMLGQMLTESLLLGLLAGGAGLAMAQLGLATLSAYVAARLPIPIALRLSPAVLGTLVGMTLLSVALIGAVPALLAARGAGLAGLRGSADVAGGRAQRRMHDALVVAEIALALALLAGAGLMLRTIEALGRVPLGFTTENVVSSSFLIPAGKFEKENIDTGFYQPVLERVEQMPGVAAAAFTSVIPLSTYFSMTGQFGIVGQRNLRNDQVPQGQLRISSPEYPEALGVGLARGRFFDAKIDTLASPRVVVINQAMARRYFAGTDPIGKQLAMGKKGPWAAVTIIGVLDDVHETGVAAPPPPTMHFSTTQLEPGAMLYGVGSMFTALVVRGKIAPGALVPGLRSVLQETAPEIGVKNFVSMRQVVATSISGPTLAARLVAIFAAAALAIALAGLYGLLSYAVSQRTREIGIRMALGAERRAILRLVLGRAGVLLGVGIGVGVGLALVGAALLRGFLYGVPARDPVTLAAVAGMLAACGLAAAYLPARRAAETSPLTALRAE